MWRLSSVALIAILVPLAAPAADLTFDITGAVDYDSNVFRRDSGKGNRDIEEDALFRLRPGVELHEDRGQDVNYSLKYMAPVEFSSQYSQLNDFDQLANGEVSYHPTDRMEFFARDRFRYLRSTLVNRTVDTPTGPQVDSGRDRVTINDLTLGGRYLFSPRLTGQIEASHRLFETSRRDRQDNHEASLSLDGFYTVSSRHQAGFGARYVYQYLEESSLVVRTESNSINLFAQWQWQVDEVTAFEAAVGPAFIYVEQGRVPQIPNLPPPAVPLFAASPPKHDDSLDLFAQAGLVRTWTPNLTTGARYVRSQGVASGAGGSVISDRGTATLDWTFRERWELTLRGDIVKRKSVNSVNTFRSATISGLTSRLETLRWAFTGRLSHQLRRTTRLFGQVLYNNQSSQSNSIASSSDFEGWIVTIGLNHVFEPIKLW
jgi:hypothetical protein